MKRIGAALSLLAGLVWMAADADSSCRVAAARHHDAAVVVVPVLEAASYAPYAATSYGVSYSGGSQEQLIKFLINRFEAQDAQLKAQDAELKALRYELRSLGGGVGPLRNPGDDVSKGEDALRTNCASCHEATAAKGKGTSFVMFDGAKIVKLTDRQISKMQSRMTIKDEDQMPPPKSGRVMSDEQFSDSMRYLRSITTKGS